MLDTLEYLRAKYGSAERYLLERRRSRSKSTSRARLLARLIHGRSRPRIPAAALAAGQPAGRYRRCLLRAAPASGGRRSRDSARPPTRSRAPGCASGWRSESTGQRASWLTPQLLALETMPGRLAGEEIDYLDEVERCFQTRLRRPRRPISTQVCEPNSLRCCRRARPALAPRARDERLAIPLRAPAKSSISHGPDIVRPMSPFISASDRRVAERHARQQRPWAAYNWYEGDLHSRIEINTDLPVRVTSLAGLLTTRHTPGTTWSTPGRNSDWAASRACRGVGSTDQHAGGLHQRGFGRARQAATSSTRGSGRNCSLRFATGGSSTCRLNARATNGRSIAPCTVCAPAAAMPRSCSTSRQARG